jgi:hypothetical protein
MVIWFGIALTMLPYSGDASAIDVATFFPVVIDKFPSVDIRPDPLELTARLP